MAKKQKAEVAVEEPVVVAPPKKEKKPTWQFKDRQYILKNGLSPLTYTIKSRGIFWFDEEKGYEREIKYTLNQRSPFVDEFKGDARLDHITFENGVLFVPKNKVVLQQILSLYHPQRNKLFEEVDNEAIAEDELDMLELEIEALMIAKQLDIDHAEAVLRTELGNKVSTMTSKELKRDLLVFAKRNPELFLDLAHDDDLNIRNIGIKAVENNIIKLSSDQRTFTWGTNGRKLLTVPFDENPYSALAQWFKTDEGVEVYQSVEKKLK